jgi:hypothetical protein
MEYWNDGPRERKTINMTFSAFAAHHSNIPLFHGAGEELKLQKVL